MVGSGQRLPIEGIVHNLDICIQGHHLFLDVFVMPLAGSDVVMGASWLSTLGAHIADYSTASLKFDLNLNLNLNLNGSFVQLQGGKSPLPLLRHNSITSNGSRTQMRLLKLIH